MDWTDVSNDAKPCPVPALLSSCNKPSFVYECLFAQRHTQCAVSTHRFIIIIIFGIVAELYTPRISYYLA